jgi:hypothetical protein
MNVNNKKFNHKSSQFFLARLVEFKASGHCLKLFTSSSCFDLIV